jgi:hypothetical protein
VVPKTARSKACSLPACSARRLARCSSFVLRLQCICICTMSSLPSPSPPPPLLSTYCRASTFTAAARAKRYNPSYNSLPSPLPPPHFPLLCLLTIGVAETAKPRGVDDDRSHEAVRSRLLIFHAIFCCFAPFCNLHGRFEIVFCAPVVPPLF